MMPTARLPETQPLKGSQTARQERWLSGCCSVSCTLQCGPRSWVSPQCPSVTLREATGHLAAIRSEADASQEVRRSLSLCVYELRRSWFWPLCGLQTPLPGCSYVREWGSVLVTPLLHAGATGVQAQVLGHLLRGTPGGQAESGW